MFRILMFFTVLFVPFLNVHAQETAFLRIDVRLDQPLPDGDRLYLRGDHIFLGAWNYGVVPLKKRGERTWSGILIMNKGEEIAFVVDRGRPSVGEVTDTIFHKVVKDTLLAISYTVGDYERIPYGIIHNVPGTVRSAIAPRAVRVRTPFGYEADTTRRYPVLYLHDGQFVLGDDPANLNHWNVARTVDSLEYRGIIEPFILVCIDHVFLNRSIEYSDTEIGQRYRTYIAKELVPVVDQMFRTKADPIHRCIGGGMAGGFVSSLLANEHPELFGNVLALSPAYKVGDNDFLATLRRDSLLQDNLNYFIDVGEFEMDTLVKPGCDEVVRVLDSLGNDVKYTFAPNTIPNGENFKTRIIPALMYFFKKEQ